MHWYSASAWENHTQKHVQENLPIYPDDLTFSQQFAYVSGDEATPSTSKCTLEFPNKEVIHKRAEAAKQFLEEGGQSTFHCPTTKDSELISYGSFSFCLSYCKLNISLLTESILMLGDKLSPGTK